jgi:hypothetical protein
MPEVFGLGWILRHFGFFGVIIWLLAGSFVSAVLGIWLAKRSLGSDKWWPCWAIAIFLFAGWLVNFGVSLAYDKESHVWWVVASLMAVFAFFVGFLLIEQGSCNLLSKKRGGYGEPSESQQKIIMLLAFSLLWGISCTTFISNEGALLSLTKAERVYWWCSRLTAGYEINEYILPTAGGLPNQIDSAFWAISRYKEKPIPGQWYYYAAGNMRLAKRSEAAKYFRMYAKTLPEDQQSKWRALENFFDNDFWGAERHFKKSGENFLSLLSKFRNNQLTGKELADFKTLPSEGLMVIMAEIISKEEGEKKVKSAEKPKEEGTETALLKSDLAALKRVLWLNVRVATGKSSAEEQEEFAKLTASPASSSLPSPFVEDKEKKRIAGLKDGVNAEIERRVISYALGKQTTLPVSAEWLNKNPAMPRAVSFFFFPASLGLLLVFSRPLRNEEKRSRFLKKVQARISWHSLSGRKLAARVALLEPAEEKGLFTREVAAIHEALFPSDILLGLRYLAKAKRATSFKQVAQEEINDLTFFMEKIRQLSGELIPYGDETVLGIISVLRKKAEDIIFTFRKDNSQFPKAREALLDVYKELQTLADILEVQSSRPEITYYNLLGLKSGGGLSDEQLKGAYRCIISAIHPDRNQGNGIASALTATVNMAYRTLKDPHRRAVYNASIGIKKL